MTNSIEGFEDHEIAHLSPRMREKLAAERNRGKASVSDAQKAADYNRQIQERAREHKRLDPEEIRKQREHAQSRRAELAAEQQAENSTANLQKEAEDAHESLNGVNYTPDPAAAAAAKELVRQRVEQARRVGLQPNQGFIGHPEASEEQALAAEANAAKEVQDRAEAANYDAAGTYQGHTEDVVAPAYDEWGNPLGDGNENEQAGGVEETQEGNGQPEYVPELTATDLMGGVGEPEQRPRRRGRPPKGQQAIGDGPKSE
jgi:hypothetical protein